MAAVLVAAVALVAYVTEYLQFLPEPDNTGGSDYSYFLTQLLAGYYWFSNNGLFSVPWFTPAFCAGIPYYANMQAMYFSLPQFLSFVVNPVYALQITFVTFAVAGFGGFYVLGRRAFGLSPWIALAAAIMFLFNEFYPARMVIGHLAFHAFMLTPIVAACSLAGVRSAAPIKFFDFWVLIGALAIGYMVQSGMVHALLPSLFAIACIILVHGYLFGLSAAPFVRLMIMGGGALVLSAAKLVAGVAYLSQFPREMIPLSGFGSIWQSFYIALHSLFIAPPFVPAAAWIQNNQWFPDTKVLLALHEFEYGITFIPAFVIPTWIGVKLLRKYRRGPHAEDRSSSSRAARIMVLLSLGLLLSVPILLNWYQESWTAFLKSTPIIGNSSTMIRWLCMYIPFVILVTGLAIDREKTFEKFRAYVAAAIVAVVLVGTLTTDREYYEFRGDYDFRTVAAAHAVVRNGGPLPAIERVDWPTISNRELIYRRDRNESFITGGTNAMCYEPMFGHRLEEYPYGALREGATLEIVDGLTNIKNPACMLYPTSNECKPGDHFTASQVASAKAFVNYRPFQFETPWWQKVANAVSLIGFATALCSLAFYAFNYLRTASHAWGQELQQESA